MKYIIFFVLINFARYECKCNETQILDSKMSPTNPLNITTNKHSRDINDCQKPSFANYTRGKKRFISISDDTFEEYLKTVDLTLYDGLLEYDQFKNWTCPQDIINDFPQYLSGYDRENRPIFVSEVGKYRLAKYASGGTEMLASAVKCVQYGIYQILKAMAFKSTRENPVHEYIEIVDYEGVKPQNVLNRAVLKLNLKYAKLFYNFHHKYRHKGVFLNVNPIAEIILNSFRSLSIRRQDANKFIVFGTNRAFWVPKLVQVFGKYPLSDKYGGCKGFLPTYVV